MAGVLSVCSARELVTTSASDSEGGMYLSVAAIASMRAIAAGDASANHSPPSDANDFCGAK